MLVIDEIKFDVKSEEVIINELKSIYPVIKKIYKVHCTRISRKIDVDFFDKVVKMCDELAGYYVRIENVNLKKKFFYIVLIKERDKKIYEPVFEELYLNYIPKIFFSKDYFDPFTRYRLSYFVSSRNMDDFEQTVAALFMFAPYTVDRIKFKNKGDMIYGYERKRRVLEEEHYDEPRDYALLAMGLYLNMNTNLPGRPFEEDRFIHLSKKLIDSCYDSLVHDGVINPKFMSLLDFTHKVLIHEFGHAVFDNEYFTKGVITDSNIMEREANFYASSMFSGKFDREIFALTTMQPKMYKNPLLVSQRFIVYDYDSFRKSLLVR